jgi:hypothetical protein
MAYRCLNHTTLTYPTGIELNVFANEELLVNTQNEEKVTADKE